jgi:RNA polymerase-binding transcription factor DksA
MATKKVAPSKAAKTAPAKKSPAQPLKGATKTAAPKATRPAPEKAAASKTVPLKAAKKTVAAKTVTAPAKAAPAKPVAQAAPKAAAKPASVKPEPTASKSDAVKAAPAKAAKEPVVKPAVEAPSKEEVKPAIKPLAKPATKKEPAKPFVIPKTSTTKSVKYEPEFTKSVLDTSQNQEPTGPNMRYSDAELQEFRDLINRKLDTAKKELSYLQGLITRKDESGDLDEGRYMTMEDGSMSMEREQLSQMASRQIQFIDHLEKAIMRIENKTYGVCRVTGKLIEKARLRAVPHATLSIEAKQMMNK